MSPTHSSIIVFDIETIPDTDTCSLLLKDDSIKHLSIKEQRQKMVDYHLGITDGKNSFLRQPFHKVVAISALHAHINHSYGKVESFDFNKVDSLGTVEDTEKDLVSKFFSIIEKAKPRLISFNGRTFDIPVLQYRAMVHGIQSPEFYNLGDKWNSYTQRYSLDWHCDLIELFSHFGTSARVKMSELCAVFKLPGKIGVDGSNVSDLYDKGELVVIRDYCQVDTINTYLLYLRAMHHRGVINTKSYNNSVEILIQHMRERELPFFSQFIDEWMEITNNNPFL